MFYAAIDDLTDMNCDTAHISNHVSNSVLNASLTEAIRHTHCNYIKQETLANAKVSARQPWYIGLPKNVK